MHCEVVGWEMVGWLSGCMSQEYCLLFCELMSKCVFNSDDLRWRD